MTTSQRLMTTRFHSVRSTSSRTSLSSHSTRANKWFSTACSIRAIREEGKHIFTQWCCRETTVLALDCERILTKKGERVARVSIVNYYGNVVFDTLVKPWSEVYDYREWITGIKPLDLLNAPSFSKIAPIVRQSSLLTL